jgi:hypothetical protein
MRIATLALVVALAGVCCAPPVANAGHSPDASAASVLNGNENAYLHLVRTYGSTPFEQGPASGASARQMRARLVVGSTFSDSFTGSRTRGSFETQMHPPHKPRLHRARSHGGVGGLLHGYGSGSSVRRSGRHPFT